MANLASLKLLQQSQEPFHIIEEFSALSPKRKMLLCDHLFIEGKKTFNSTVSLLWPEATNTDIKKLEKFLQLLKNTAH